MRAAPLGGSRALQHRRRRLRSPSAREARDDPRGLPRQRPRGRLGRAAGHLQPLRQRARVAWRRRATGSRCCCRRRPETAAAFFGTWKLGAILLSMSVLYGDEGIRHRVTDSQAKVLVTNAANADRIERALVEHVLVLDDDAAGDGVQRASRASTPPPRTPRSSTTPPARRAWRRGSCTPTATCSRTRSSIYCHDVRDGRAVPRDGRVGLGRRASAR